MGGREGVHFYSPHLFFFFSRFWFLFFIFANEFFSIAHLLGDPGERKQGNHLLEDRVHLSVPLPHGIVPFRVPSHFVFVFVFVFVFPFCFFFFFSSFFLEGASDFYNLLSGLSSMCSSISFPGQGWRGLEILGASAAL